MAELDTQLRLAPLFRWFRAHKRDLPWRKEPRDPYHVWLSEVMLQQTQVATVLPYFERWLRRYPTLRDFASAPIDDVLKLWEGLGYYARARNFHRAAQAVVREHGGRIPSEVDALQALPGVGPYTAGAVASLAFNQDAAVLDGNVKRVLSRLFALRAASDAELWQLARQLLPARRAALFNESLMELGATVCTPRQPRCAECPLRTQCRAYASGEPEQYPQRTRKVAPPHYDVLTVALIDPAGRALLGQRPRDGLLGGLWEFISTDYRAAASESIAQLLARRAGLAVDASGAQLLGTVRHAFTHFRITRQVWLLAVRGPAVEAQPGGYDRLCWASPREVRELALTRSDQRILELLEAHQRSLGCG